MSLTPGASHSHSPAAATTESVLEIVRERISSQVLPPGSRIQEMEVAREFGISRSRVREVFGALEQRGLIERIPNRGAIVTRLEPKEVFEVFDVREVLEGLCVRLATQYAPDGEWDALSAKFGEPMAQAIAAGDIEAYLAGLDELRALILHWADNTHARIFLDEVSDKARVIARRVTVLPGRAEVGRRMHQDMLRAMRERDMVKAEQLKREIIRSARGWLERYREFVF